MSKRSSFSYTLLRQGLSLSLLFVAFSTAAQVKQSASVDNRTQGIELLKTGDAAGATKLLSAATKRDKNDIEAWHWLGVALERLGKLGDARKIHEKAAKLADKRQTSMLDQQGTLPKTDLLAAAESADRYIALATNLSQKKIQEWRDRADFLRVFAADDSLATAIYKSKEVTTKARVLAKPEPSYTEEARKNQITGTVVLRAVFAADGRVRAINVIRGLPDGLTRCAIVAAQRIKFVPAMKDGKPVSMWMQVEYNFNLY